MKNIYYLIILTSLLISNCKKIEGPEGKISLVDLILEPSGINCSNGGFKILAGIDLNGNNTLDAEEIQQTKYVCNGNNGAYDKELIIHLSADLSNDSAIPRISAAILPYFDINNYLNIDSVVFAVGNIRTFDHNYNDVIGNAKYELFDMTNSKIIEMSTIISDDIPYNTLKYSKNLIDYLPKAKVQLGIRITSGVDYISGCGNIYLILIRK